MSTRELIVMYVTANSEIAKKIAVNALRKKGNFLF